MWAGTRAACAPRHQDQSHLPCPLPLFSPFPACFLCFLSRLPCTCASPLLSCCTAALRGLGLGRYRDVSISLSVDPFDTIFWSVFYLPWWVLLRAHIQLEQEKPRQSLEP